MKALKKLVPVELDRDRHLYYDFNAFAEAEQASGQKLLGAGSDAFWRAAGGARRLRLLVWAGLIHEDPGLTLEDAGRLITMENAARIDAAITEALLVFFGEAAERPPQAGTPASAPAGSSSGPSAASTSA